MNTCGTCKYFGEPRGIGYWDAEADEWVDVTRFRKCNLLQHLNDSGAMPALANVPAGVIDGSGYAAALCVSDEFGCNQWSAATVRGDE